MEQIIQATGVSFEGIGLAIMGQSGIGKTSLALNLIDAGGVLVGDDAVVVEEVNGEAFMSPVPVTRGKIEIRGVGILSGLSVVEKQKIDAVICLQVDEVKRFPDKLETYSLCDIDLPLFSLRGDDFSLTSKVKMIIKILKRQVNLNEVG